MVQLSRVDYSAKWGGRMAVRQRSKRRRVQNEHVLGNSGLGKRDEGERERG